MSRQRGFSLIELLTVVAILGVAALIAMAAWREYYGRADVKNGARVVATTIQLARSMAVSRGMTHFVVIDGSTISIYSDNSAPFNRFDAADIQVSSQQIPSSVQLAMPAGIATLPNPLGGSPVTTAWQIPGPDTTGRWGSNLKGFLVTSTGLIESAELTPQVVETGVMVFSGTSGTTAAVALRGQFGSCYPFYWLDQWIRIAG